MLLGSELTFVNAQFYLVFIGAAALIVGFLDLAGALPADWLQWSVVRDSGQRVDGRVSAAGLRAHAPQLARISSSVPRARR